MACRQQCPRLLAEDEAVEPHGGFKGPMEVPVEAWVAVLAEVPVEVPGGCGCPYLDMEAPLVVQVVKAHPIHDLNELLEVLMVFDRPCVVPRVACRHTMAGHTGYIAGSPIC